MGTLTLPFACEDGRTQNVDEGEILTAVGAVALVAHFYQARFLDFHLILSRLSCNYHN